MALSAKVGSFNANTSNGNQAVTGVGFQGKALLLWGDRVASDSGFNANMQFFIGAATSSAQRWAIALAADDAATTLPVGRDGSAAEVNRQISDASAPSLNARGDFVSFDADGFTINWVDAPSVASRMNYLVLGGTDITAQKAGTITLAAAGGATQAFTDPGFEPDVVLLFHSGQTTLGNEAHLLFGVGFASSASDQAAIAHSALDLSDPTQVGFWQKSGRVLLNLTTAGAADCEAALQSFDTNGFTLAVSDTPATDIAVGYIAIQGGAWKTGVDTQHTTTGTKDTTVGFTPKLGVFASCNVASSSSINTGAHQKFSMGTGDGATEIAQWWQVDDAVGTSNANRHRSVTKALTMCTANTTLNAEADLSFGSGVLTLDWTTADATAREFVYLAAGDTVVVTDTFVPRVTVF